MDILLINSIDFTSSSIHPQIGQLIIKEILKDKYEVDFVNFDYLNYTKELEFKDHIDLNIEAFTTYIVNKKPKVVGFYTICNSFIFSVKIAEKIKKLNPNINIIFGGPHATLTSDECMRNLPFLDVISLNESEKSILPLVEALLQKKDLKSVSGIVYRKDNQIFKNENVNLISNEELGTYTVFDYSPDVITKDSTIELEGGRGCPFECTFCSTSPFWGRRFRIKPLDVLISEMKKFNEMYGVTDFSIVHDMFTTNKKYIQSFCNTLIKENSPFKWGCSSRIDVLDKETLLLMKKANCTGIYLGIETGSKRLQSILNKKLNLDNALEMISFINDNKIDVTLSFIYGFPEETIEDFTNTVTMIEKILLQDIRKVQLHRFMTLPRTVETAKVKDKLYFDSMDVDFSIYDKKLFTKEYEDFIRDYPEIFIQYYTFYSDVRTTFKKFDFLILVLASVMGVYSCCVRYVIKKYGLKNIYLKYEAQILDLYEEENCLKISESVKRDSFIKNMIVFTKIIFDDEIKLHDSEYFQQLYKYEDILNDYVRSENKNDKYYEFSIDIMEARKSGKCVEEKTFIKFSYENSSPKVTKVNLYSGEKKWC